MDNSMENLKHRQKELTKKLFYSRLRLLTKLPFFSVLLFNMEFAFTYQIDRFDTDGKHIYVNPDFLESISDEDVDLCIGHLLMHIALKHHLRYKTDYDKKQYERACDIVVNSNLMHSMQSSFIFRDKEIEHLTPDGNEGYKYSVEDIYDMFQLYFPSELEEGAENGASVNIDGDPMDSPSGNNDASCKSEPKDSKNGINRMDTHDFWGKNNDSDDILSEDEINKMLVDGNEISKNLFQGNVPGFMKELIDNLTKPKIDWRVLIQNFLQENPVDYSFNPPDNRYPTSEFILPGFSELDEKPGKILFMVDVSGSMSHQQIVDCFSEIQGAIEQFNGRLEGQLGFFDVFVHKVHDFDSETKIEGMIIEGRGGTSFRCVFDYLEKQKDDLPKKVIILTDGYADFPDKKFSLGVPVLWVINNHEITPPWGEIARLK